MHVPYVGGQIFSKRKGNRILIYRNIPQNFYKNIFQFKITHGILHEFSIKQVTNLLRFVTEIFDNCVKKSVKIIVFCYHYIEVWIPKLRGLRQLVHICYF